VAQARRDGLGGEAAEEGEDDERPGAVRVLQRGARKRTRAELEEGVPITLRFADGDVVVVVVVAEEEGGPKGGG
jgi:hypothetical protein